MIYGFFEKLDAVELGLLNHLNTFCFIFYGVGSVIVFMLRFAAQPMWLGVPTNPRVGGVFCHSFHV